MPDRDAYRSRRGEVAETFIDRGKKTEPLPRLGAPPEEFLQSRKVGRGECSVEIRGEQLVIAGSHAVRASSRSTHSASSCRIRQSN